ncbi:MAG: ArnT family glycosyltransferase [Desulfomonilaceae bacterium]
MLTLRGSLAALAVVWAVAIYVIGPGGEFFVNDDWSFVRAFEHFVASGRMASTGWGPSYAPGGPALLVHILWGRLFTLVAGQSVTALRVSVLVMGILGSVGMLVLLRRAGCSALTSLVGAIAIATNPLYLSQSFTFMSDVTFAALSVYALLFLSLAVQNRSGPLLIIGFAFCLASILVRQIGAVMVVAFLWMCLMHPRCRSLGFFKSLAAAILVVFLPWFLYEYGLFMRGGTPLFQHQVVYDLIRNFSERSWSGYATLLACNLLGALLYCGLFTSPIWLLRFRQFLRKKGFVVFLAIALTAFVIVEIGILTRGWKPPVFFWGNVILNFAFGPILLKDAAILKIHRVGHLEPWAYYIWALVATLGVGIMVGRIRFALRELFKRSSEREDASFLGGLALWSGLFYLAFICASGFHDRYLMPLIVWFMAWLAAEDPERTSPRSAPAGAAALAMTGVIAALSIAGVRDFMEMKRAQYKAQQYMVGQLQLDPCSCDGGFEFNGYHCYHNAFQPAAGKSWWWVRDEKAVLTLGPLPGYRVQRVFPFHRVVGPNGAIHVLIPESQ